MYLATKVKNTTNYEGVVIATLSSSSFNQVISNVSIGENGYGFIVDSSGKIIADKNRDNVDSFINYSDLAQKDQTYAGAASLTTKMVGRQAGKTYCDINGTSYYAFYAPLLNTDNWAIAVLADTAEMMSGFYQSIWITVGVAVLFVILSIIIAFRIANPIVKPVVSLVKRIESLSEGDLHTEVPKVKSRDEISTLSLAFQDTINSLNTYIEDIRNVLGSISQGDYTVQIDREYKGDFVAIRESLNYIVRSLNKTFGEINQVSDQIAAGSQQMASGAQVLAQGATEQAGTVQELSASMSEISDQVNRNAENARNADLISKEATQEVEKGDGHMTRMITAMDKISETSGSIGKIIKTIQDIAFQTNILALNAAVEAARAGEAGKGFAVVADEVRNLASKSAEAAKNTSLLIQDSFSAVEDGQKVAADTAQSLKEIVKKVQGMTELFDKITRASQEQARSIAQVNQGVEQISAVVQTNSANAEQSAATSEELDRQVQLLKEEFAKLQLMDAETLAEAEEAARNLMDDGGPEDQAPEEEETPSASEEPEQPEQPVTVS
jgi:methyl-accepting chemotaxis protein